MHDVKLNINGLFFKNDSDVLVEVVVDDCLKSHLIAIYEERLGTKILKNKPINNIIKLCDGKFSRVVNNDVMFFVILSNVKTILFPCKSLVFPFGLSNSEIINMESDSFIVDERFSVYETFSLLKEEIGESFFECFIGMKMELCDEFSNTTHIRISLRHKSITLNFLNKLKKNLWKGFLCCFDSTFVSSSLIG